MNQTQDSLQIDCVQGFSSGLRQEFHLEVSERFRVGETAATTQIIIHQ